MIVYSSILLGRIGQADDMYVHTIRAHGGIQTLAKLTKMDSIEV
jgi:hypothetical protein